MANLDVSVRSAINQLAPLWRIRLIEAANGTDAMEINELEKDLSALCRRQASLLCQRIDISGENANWAESYFSSHIANMIADRWAESPVDARNFHYAEHLASIATEPMYAGLPSSWRNTDSEVSFVATTVTAISRCLQAYAKFNLFHFDKPSIQNFFTEQIITTAQEATRLVTPKLTSLPDINSGSSLYQTFIRHAGSALADLWTSASMDIISQYTLASEDEKQELRTPYNLETISQNLSGSMRALAEAAITSLEAGHQLNVSNTLSPA